VLLGSRSAPSEIIISAFSLLHVQYRLSINMGSPGSVIVDLLLMSRLNGSSLALPSPRFTGDGLHDPRVQLHHILVRQPGIFSSKWQQVQTVAVVNECCHLLWLGYIPVCLGPYFFGLRV
jgi:hypothetical protein